MILLCSISCSDVNGDGVDCAGDDGSVIFNSIMCAYLSHEIRFEAPKRPREGDREDCKMLLQS
jgi:hypothetical protein